MFLPLELNAERFTPETVRAGMDVQTPDLNLVGEIIELDAERERFRLLIKYASGQTTEMWRDYDDLDELMAA